MKAPFRFELGRPSRADWFAKISLCSALALVCTSCVSYRAAQTRQITNTLYSSARLADGKQWMTENLSLDTPGSYCYREVQRNCRRYGRLYTWESALRGCQALGDGWQLPTDSDWRRMASHYGGVFDDSDDSGQAAYAALLMGGRSGFDAVLGGGRSDDGRYDDLEAHGFYWTASESDAVTALYYNFGRGSRGFYRQPEGEKQMALAVRCVKQ